MSIAGRTQSPTVLLASEDAAERAALVRALAGGGLGVTEAAAADVVLRRAAEQGPQLVLLGAALGDLPALEVCRRLRADPATAAIPVLLLCGPGDPEAAPGPAADLVARVQSLIRLHHAEERAARREAKEGLRQSEERYRTLFERNPHPMFVYDCETLAYLAVNDAAVHQYGYSREEFLRMTLADLRPPEDVPALLDSLRASAPGFERRGAWRHRKKDGSVIDVEILAHALPFGDRPACIVLAYDVTERRRLEEQLVQAQKMEAVGRLAGGVAHDFNNLLTVINGYADMLLEDLGEGGACAEYVRAIRKAGDRAAALTRQLLAFGRKQVVAPRLLDLNAVVAGAADMLRRLIGEDVLLTIDAQPDLGRVRADPAQLEQVIVNLAVNARDAMPRGGRLSVTTRDTVLGEGEAGAGPGPHVMLAVADTGHGMTTEVRRHLFEPFFTTRPAGQGTGLGLATVYGIVKQAGGHIAVETGPGAGTTFRIYLPRAADPLAEQPPAAAAAGAAARAALLLAEDEDAVRALAKHVLRAAGYDVLEACDGAEALRLAEQHGGRIDLLVSDLIMPGLSGRQLAERLLARDAGLKVLYLSGYTEDEVVRDGVSREAVHYLQKPFSPAALTRKVREVLGW
jgi:PAS domain S-box-containing protein